ncbi:uncharacterized protein LOC141716723 isoform X2 [Apium graveolens]|uniref:uncharacterized protein LOC141716723 isoform X2 n=1 Tax=Apium graveolens TaxID=4045 RepID=UPI003D7B07F8
MDVLGVHMPPRIYFVICICHEAVGSFNENDNRITGLASVCNMLDVLDFSGKYMLLFVFDGNSRLRVRVFENSQIETPIGQFLSRLGEAAVGNKTTLQFEVKASHMLDYDYGMECVSALVDGGSYISIC